MDHAALLAGMHHIKDAGFVDWANAGARMLGGAVTRGIRRAAVGAGVATNGQVAKAVNQGVQATGGLQNFRQAVGYGTLGVGALGAGAMGAGYLGGRMSR